MNERDTLDVALVVCRQKETELRAAMAQQLPLDRWMPLFTEVVTLRLKAMSLQLQSLKAPR